MPALCCRSTTDTLTGANITFVIRVGEGEEDVLTCLAGKRQNRMLAAPSRMSDPRPVKDSLVCNMHARIGSRPAPKTA